MAATPTVYVICDQNCKFEGMTKEQILTAIAQAVATGEIKDVDTGFVTTIKTINGIPLKFFVGEQSAYDALTDEEKINLYAIITNDATLSGITAAIEKLQTDLKELSEGLLSGDIVVKNAESAKTLRYGSLANGTDLNDITTFGDYIRSGSSHLITIYNSPTAHAFYMQVTSSGAGIRQEITTYDNNNPKKYYRTYYNYNDEGGWGDWKEIATREDFNDLCGNGSLNVLSIRGSGLYQFDITVMASALSGYQQDFKTLATAYYDGGASGKSTVILLAVDIGYNSAATPQYNGEEYAYRLHITPDGKARVEYALTTSGAYIMWQNVNNVTILSRKLS